MSEIKDGGRIVLVAGLAGSGKTTVLNTLEDNNYLTIDNLPLILLPKLLALSKESGDFLRLAIGLDIRNPKHLTQWGTIFNEAQKQGYEFNLIFLEAEVNTLIKRFSETRRPHPLAPKGDLLKGIEDEKKLWAPVRNLATNIIDTSNYTAAQLRELIIKRFTCDAAFEKMVVEFLSFGFKNGLSPEIDLLIDVRFLPNPFYIDELRYLNGTDKKVSDYVLNNPEAVGFLKHYEQLLKYLIPLYQKEGKTYLTIAVGCTGGQHRSVAISEYLKKSLEGFVKDVSLRHRDMV